MKQSDFNKLHQLHDLVSRYEEMSQQGGADFYEENEFIQLIEYYTDHDASERAFQITNNALVQHPFSVDLYTFQVQLLFRAGRVDDALLALENAFAYSPFDFSLKMLRVSILIASSSYKEALSDLKKIESTIHFQNERTEICMFRAIIYEKRKEYYKMFQALRDALLISPDHEEALAKIQVCVEINGNYEESLVLHNKLVNLTPDSCWAWYNLGSAQFCLGNFEEAINAYEFACAIDEDFKAAYWECATALVTIKNYTKAIKYYKELLDRFDCELDGCELWIQLGICYEELKEFEHAQAAYKKALKLDPYHDGAHYRVGTCFGQKREWKKAIAAYRKAIELDDLKEEYLLALAEAYWQQGDVKNAARYFSIAADTAPDQSECWLRYCSFLIEVGLPARALDVLEEAEANTCSSEFTYYRAACLFLLDRRGEGLAILEQALDKNRDSGAALFGILPALEKDVDVVDKISAYRA